MLLIFGVGLSSAGSARAELIPASSLPPAGTWESAGVEGGIPDRQTICADVTQAPYNADNTGNASATSAIQNAINSCPAGQVVFVPPGRYLVDGGLTIRRSITLRGAGTHATVFDARSRILIGGQNPWPVPKVDASYAMNVTAGATRNSTQVTVANASAVEVGEMIMFDEIDDPSIVWAKNGSVNRYRASLHMVEATSGNTVTFRPALPITYDASPRLVLQPGVVTMAGVEGIKFEGTGSSPGSFIEAFGVWNCWVYDCEFTNMPAKVIVLGWVGHFEVRKNYLHHQSNGGPNSEGIDLLTDSNWSLVVDNIAVEAGFPAITIGDGGASDRYSGGFGNVIAYNYCVDSFYTDPPTSTNHGMMTFDISANHSPHSQYNLLEGNIVGKIGADGYHGSGSHTVLLRNIATGRNRWTNAVSRVAISIDRRNQHWSLIGNVLGEVGNPADHEYVTQSNWSGDTIFRLGYPDVGNNGVSGVHPPTPIAYSDGGPRDLYVDRNDTQYGTTTIEGNWTSTQDAQDWTVSPEAIPNSLYLTARPAWFGNLAWPPVDPAHPVTDDPTIIPAGYRYLHGMDPPGGSNPPLDECAALAGVCCAGSESCDGGTSVASSDCGLRCCTGGTCAEPCVGCGDGTCDSSEDCDSCPSDCGTCAPACDNGICDPAEDCTSCPPDCGTCTATCDPATGQGCVLQGLLAHWEFNEGEGYSADDASGNGHEGLLHDANWSSGVWGGAGQFDGTASYVDVSSVKPRGESLTVALWMRADSFAATDGRLISKATGVQTVQHDFMLSTAAVSGGIKSRARLQTSSGATTLVGSGPGLEVGRWTHLALVYNGSELKLYQDGAEVGSTPMSGPITDTAPSTWIGRNPADGPAFAGAIDDVRIYDTALSAAELEALIAGTASTPECVVDAECGDGDDCTEDTCDDGACSSVHIPNCGDDVVEVPNGTCELDDDCQDGDSCTYDVCNEGRCISVEISDCAADGPIVVGCQQVGGAAWLSMLSVLTAAFWRRRRSLRQGTEA